MKKDKGVCWGGAGAIQGDWWGSKRRSNYFGVHSPSQIGRRLISHRPLALTDTPTPHAHSLTLTGESELSNLQQRPNGVRANGLLSVCFLFFFTPSEGPSDRVVTSGSGFSLVEMRIFSSGCTPFFWVECALLFCFNNTIYTLWPEQWVYWKSWDHWTTQIKHFAKCFAVKTTMFRLFLFEAR